MVSVIIFILLLTLPASILVTAENRILLPAYITVNDDKNNIVLTKWGYIDDKGKFVIQPMYERAHLFGSNGLAAVESYEGENYAGREFYINKDGRMIMDRSAQSMDAKYFLNSIFTAGYSLFIKNVRDGRKSVNYMEVYDKTGKFLYKRYFILDSTNKEGIAVVDTRSKYPDNISETYYKYFDLFRNRLVFDKSFDCALRFMNGRALVRIDKNYYLIDSKGNILNKFPYYITSETHDPSKFIYWDMTKNTVGLIDSKNKIDIKDLHQGLQPFHNCDYLCIGNGNPGSETYGVMDYHGKLLIPCKYDQDMHHLKNGTFKPVFSKVKYKGYAVIDLFYGKYIEIVTREDHGYSRMIYMDTDGGIIWSSPRVMTIQGNIAVNDGTYILHEYDAVEYDPGEEYNVLDYSPYYEK